MAYSDFNAKNVQFLQGTQANLNALMSDGARAGQAINGAFYLTTDTQRLYIGRLVANSIDAQHPNGIVYPELISAGITTVQNTTALNQLQSIVRDGDIVYIQEGNILAVYEANDPGSQVSGATGKWIQVNPATGINGFSQSITDISDTTAGNGTSGIITSTISAENGNSTSSFALKEGSNIKLTKASGNDQALHNSNRIPTLVIDATDTTYTIGTSSNASKGIIGLKKNGASSLDSSLDIEGAQNVGVSSNGTKIIVTGPSFNSLSFSSVANSGNGFNATLGITSGDGTTDSSVSTSSPFDPTVRIGSGTTSDVHFVNGTAILDVYTKTQTDTAIENKINDKIAEADAMTYRGSVNSYGTSSDAGSLVKAITDNGAHIGDTYKVSAQIDNLPDYDTSANAVQTAYPGDLIILRSSTNEETGTNDTIASGNLRFDVIPSGDEPNTQGIIVASNNSSLDNPYFQLYDGKLASNDSSYNLLKVQFAKTGNKIRVDSSITDQKNGTITINHTGSAASINLNKTGGLSTLPVNSAVTALSDSIQGNSVEFWVLDNTNSNNDGTSGIITDSFGHLTNVNGRKVTFAHNKLSSAKSFIQSLNAANKTATIRTQVIDDLNTTVNADLYFSSSTLSVEQSKSDSNLQYYDTFSLDLVWGSFDPAS